MFLSDPMVEHISERDTLDWRFGSRLCWTYKYAISPVWQGKWGEGWVLWVAGFLEGIGRGKEMVNWADG